MHTHAKLIKIIPNGSRVMTIFTNCPRTDGRSDSRGYSAHLYVAQYHELAHLVSLRSAMAGRLYKHPHIKFRFRRHLYAVLRLYFIRCRTTSGVPNIVGRPTARSKLSVKSVGLPKKREASSFANLIFTKKAPICPVTYINAISISFSEKLAKVKRPKVKTSLIGKQCERTSHQ